MALLIGFSSAYSQSSEHGKQLLSENFSEAKKALDEVVEKNNSAQTCLALSNSDWLIRSYAGKALKQITDGDSVPCLVKALEKNQDILSGGSEARVSQMELNTDLVDALNRITKLDLVTKSKYEKEDIEQISRDANQWYLLFVNKKLGEF